MTPDEIRNDYWKTILHLFTYEEPIIVGGTVGKSKTKPLERQGIFVPGSHNMTDFCPRCKDWTPIEVHKDSKGRDGYWRVCCFPIIRLPARMFRLWHLREEPVLRLFAGAVGIKGARTELVPGRVWKLGRRGQQGFIYINRVMIPDLKTLAPILSRFPGAIFVAPTQEVLERLEIILPNRGMAFEDVSRLDERYKIHFDLEKIEAIITPEASAPNKPAARRGNRSANIEKLVAELKEHYRAAKDYYYSTDGKILPRPTQAELAQQLQMRQNDVSRCLNDPDAGTLRFLWDYAEDERAILNKQPIR